MIDFRELIKAGSHFGHQTSRWCPKMAPYIWGLKSKVHLIDVSKTAFQLEKAAMFLGEIAAENKQILWVGTKRPAQKIIEDVAKKFDMPYVSHRWIGGTLSNYEQVKKSVTRLLHYEDVLVKAETHPYYTKKELNVFQKLVHRLEKSVGGIRTLKWPVGAVVLIDVGKEGAALLEAAAMGVPVVAIVDTNGDPSLVNYVIPANDDAPRSIQVIVDYLATFVEKGKIESAKKTAAAAEKARMLAAEKKAAADKDKPVVAVAEKKAEVKKSSVVEKAEKTVAVEKEVEVVEVTKDTIAN